MTVSIIAGRHRGRRLLTPSDSGVRPTPGVVRERLFNWLGGVVAGARVLDLFAGSGALGLEAWSRDAKEVVFVEKNPRHRALLLQNLKACGVPESQLAGKDALHYLQQHAPSFDIVFADPPFDQGWPQRLASCFAACATSENPAGFTWKARLRNNGRPQIFLKVGSLIATDIVVMLFTPCLASSRSTCAQNFSPDGLYIPALLIQSPMGMKTWSAALPSFLTRSWWPSPRKLPKIPYFL